MLTPMLMNAGFTKTKVLSNLRYAISDPLINNKLTFIDGRNISKIVQQLETPLSKLQLLFLATKLIGIGKMDASCTATTAIT